MSTEFWYFIAGLLLGLLPLAALLAAKKWPVLALRPTTKITFKTHPAQQLTLHMFAACKRTGSSTAPALLLFHGGRWLYGRPEDLYAQCRFFAAQGYTCFSAQYRLGTAGQPDVQGAVEDAQAALQYLFDHANTLHINPDKICVVGGSAGGQLAAALGAGLPLAHDSASLSTHRRPAAQVLYNPMLDLSPCTPDHHLVKDYWQQVSPRHHIDSAVPPTLILVGSQDPEVPTTCVNEFADAVHNVGGHCEVEVYQGQGHGFANSPPYREKTNKRILLFLQEYVR